MNFIELILDIDFTDQSVISLIQLISSVILVLITGIYVFLTYKIFSSQFSTHLRPLDITLDNNGQHIWNINIKNYGPSLAVNVKIQAIAYVSMKWSSSSKKYFNKMIKITSNGPFEIEASEIEEYPFNGLIDNGFPIIVEWNSINGKKNKSSWVIEIDGLNVNVKNLTLIKYIIFKVKWLYLQLKVPFITIHLLYLKYIKGEKHL